MKAAIGILAVVIIASTAPGHALELCADLSKMKDYLETADFIDRQTERIARGGSNRQLAMLYLERGIAHARNFNNEKALNDCSTALQLVPGFADAYNARGCFRASERDHGKAILDFTAALQGVNDSKVHINRGDSYAAKREYDRAIADYTEAIAIDRKSTAAYSRRGQAYVGNLEIEKAVADYTTAIRIDPQCIDAYESRGHLYLRKQDYDRAIADFTKAIRLGPPGGGYFISLNRGNAYMLKEEIDRAIADYTAAIRVKPDYTFAYDRRGFAYLAKGDFKRALADYDKLITVDPGSAHVHYALVRKGNIYRARSDYDRALKEYSRAARSNPKGREAYYERGSVYYARGDYDRAIADYNEAIKVAPQFERSYLRLVNVSRILSGEDYRASLKRLRDYVDNSSSDKWIRTVSKYYLGIGGINEETVLNEVKKEKNAFVRRIYLCEACYYLGEARLGKGDRTGAKALFKKSVETRSYASSEFYLSQEMLKRMAKKSKAVIP